MNDKFLETYEAELRYLRELAGEFAEAYPKVAGRLAINPESGEARDPFVERLLEGVAFLTSRVRVKMDAEYSTFTQSLLETVAPDFLSPVPSMAMVRFTPDGNLKAKATVARSTNLLSHLNANDLTRCSFRTAHDVELWPLRIVNDGIRVPRYFDRDLDQLSLPAGLKAKSAIRVTIETTSAVASFRQLGGLNELSFFINEDISDADQIFEACFARCKHVVIRPGSDSKSSRAKVLSEREKPLRRIGFSGKESLLPEGPQSQSGFRLLREFFSMPHRFLSFSVNGLAGVAADLNETTLDIIFAFDKSISSLEQIIGPDTFQMFVTPAVNLFEKRTNNLQIASRKNEFHLVADRARPLDYEIYSVNRIYGFGKQQSKPVEFGPFFRRSSSSGEGGRYFSVRREPRRLSSRERTYKPVSSYLGGEAYVSLVDADSVPISHDLREIGAETVCSNRHLPIELGRAESISFMADSDAPISAISCLMGPTRPVASWIEGEYAWRIVDHLSLNYQSFFDESSDSGAVIREMMYLYQPDASGDDYHWIQGIVDAECRSVIRPCPNDGGIAYAKGLGIALTLDEEKFIGSCPFLFGAVMADFFARYVSINSFAETSIQSKQRGELVRWPSYLGKRHLM